MQMMPPDINQVNQANQANQAVDQNVPNIVRTRSRWYPRWWIIAAFGCMLVVGIGMVFWDTQICGPTGAQPFICQISDWLYPIQTLLIWLLFVVFWLLALSLGMGRVEVPRREANPVGDFLRRMSEFRPMYALMMFQGIMAAVIITAMWWLDNSPPMAFAFLGIMVFLAVCSHFQRISPAERRNYLISFGILAFLSLVAEAFLKRDFFTRMPSEDEWTLLIVQFLLIVIAVIAMFRRPRPDQNMTAQEALDQSIDQVASPIAVLGSLPGFNRLFAPRVMRNNQANQGAPGPGPGAP